MAPKIMTREEKGAWKKGGVHTCFYWGKLGERDRFKDLSVNSKILLKWIFKKSFGRERPGGYLVCNGLNDVT
jgi:hypothetical protein